MNNDFIDKVSLKTKVKKEDIFYLANILQSKDLNKKEDINEFIQTLTRITNKQLTQSQVNKLIEIIQNKQIPEQFYKNVQ